MKLIRINDGTYVRADDVVEVTVPRERDYIIVRTKGGETHTVLADYGDGIYSTRDRLVKEINAALEGS